MRCRCVRLRPPQRLHAGGAAAAWVHKCRCRCRRKRKLLLAWGGGVCSSAAPHLWKARCSPWPLPRASTRTHTHINSLTHAHTRTHARTHAHINSHTRTHAHIQKHTHTHTRTRTHTHACAPPCPLAPSRCGPPPWGGRWRPTRQRHCCATAWMARCSPWPLPRTCMGWWGWGGRPARPLKHP